MVSFWYLVGSNCFYFAILKNIRRQILPDSANTLLKTNCPKRPASKGVGGRPETQRHPKSTKWRQQTLILLVWRSPRSRRVKRLNTEIRLVDWTFVLFMFFVVVRSLILVVQLLQFSSRGFAPNTSRNTKRIGLSKSSGRRNGIQNRPCGAKMSILLRNLCVFYGGLKPDRCVYAFWLPFCALCAPF